MKLQAFTLNPLPFDILKFKSLSPKSFSLHHGKHHASYVANLKTLLNNCDQDTLETVKKYYFIKDENEKNLKIYNNACQHWNHEFFWNSITPITTNIDENIKSLILKNYESMDKFIETFCLKGTALFGSGWVWIVYYYNEDKIDLIATSNGYVPSILEQCYPLLVCDIWEHAYYVDFENRRVDYLKEIFEVFNWDFAQKNLQECYKIFKDKKLIL